MRRSWHEFMRLLELPRSTLFHDGNSFSMQLGDTPKAEVMRATQHLVLGACRAAARAMDVVDENVACTTLRVHPRGPSAVDIQCAAPGVAHTDAPPHVEPAVIVDPERAADAFATVADDPHEPVDLRGLLDVFLPTALLYEETPNVRETALLGLRGPVRASKLYGLTAMGEYHGRRRFNALGDVFFTPPALRGELRARAAWIREQELDLPSWREAGGPFWRLGRYNLWRLDALGWPERLALAALTATNRRTAVVVGPSHLFPRVGFVVESARAMGRTLIGVPLEAAPARLRDAVQGARDRFLSRRAQMFMGLEGFL